MTDYLNITQNLDKAKEVLIRLQGSETALAIIEDILASNSEDISFFQHNISVSIGTFHLDSISKKNVVILEALQEKLEDDILLYKNILSGLNVKLNDETS